MPSKWFYFLFVVVAPAAIKFNIFASARVWERGREIPTECRIEKVNIGEKLIKVALNTNSTSTIADATEKAQREVNAQIKA